MLALVVVHRTSRHVLRAFVRIAATNVEETDRFASALGAMLVLRWLYFGFLVLGIQCVLRDPVLTLTGRSAGKTS
jgi:hypothetical protein